MGNPSVILIVRAIDGTEIEVQLFGGKKYPVQEIPEAEALEYGEVPVQLREGGSYEYVLPPAYGLRPIPGIASVAASKASRGRITPRNYVGTLNLEIIELSTGNKVGEVLLEVCSVKSDYREDYRTMLEDITEYCTDILLQYTSPVYQYLEPDAGQEAQTIYQRFAFVKAVLESTEFTEAVYRVQETPVTQWTQQEESIDIRRVRRMNGHLLRQLAKKPNRVDLHEEHRLKELLGSLPRSLSGTNKRQTTDCPENRFVKHVLTEFMRFCSYCANKFKLESRAYREAVQLETVLENMLAHTVFREVGQASMLALNSPVLQRKEGYREILRAWLLFDLAARLVWTGGLDVYEGGKRDVARLYEYWVFFVLLGIFRELFSLDPISLSQLFEETPDGLGLKLKKNTALTFTGKYGMAQRKLRACFQYNRTFSANTPHPAGGSWTRSMKPDFTLSVWLDELTPEEAERSEKMVHLHFDAKYKLKVMEDIPEGEDEEEAEKGFVREDLLKMHAYRDAIRRSAGAYILYPGNTAYRKTLYHELLPGTGAFPLRPTRDGSGKAELRSFIQLAIEHLLDPTTAREALASKVNELYGGIGC